MDCSQLASLPVSSTRPSGLDSGGDLAGAGSRRLRTRLLHPHGVCLTGPGRLPKIPYSGYFASRQYAARGRTYSSGRRQQSCAARSVAGTGGKLFQTLDADHAVPLRTANFITWEIARGRETESIKRTRTTNAPRRDRLPSGARRVALIKVAIVVPAGDQQPTIRQLIRCGAGETGWRADESTRVHALLVRPGNP